MKRKFIESLILNIKFRNWMKGTLQSLVNVSRIDGGIFIFLAKLIYFSKVNEETNNNKIFCFMNSFQNS